MKIFIVIVWALLLDVAYSELYDLFGVVYLNNEPIGGAFMLNEKRVLTAATFEKLEGVLRIKFGIQQGSQFICKINKFIEFKGEIKIAKFREELPQSFDKVALEKLTYIARDFYILFPVKVLDWSIDENGLIVPTELQLHNREQDEQGRTVVSIIKDCKNDKFLGCPVFQNDKVVGIVYNCVGNNLHWKLVFEPEACSSYTFN